MCTCNKKRLLISSYSAFQSTGFFDDNDDQITERHDKAPHYIA